MFLDWRTEALPVRLRAGPSQSGGGVVEGQRALQTRQLRKPQTILDPKFKFLSACLRAEDLAMGSIREGIACDESVLFGTFRMSVSIFSSISLEIAIGVKKES